MGLMHAKHHDNLQGTVYLKILRTARSNLLLPTDKMDISACRHTRVALLDYITVYISCCVPL